MNTFENLKTKLEADPKIWLITGVAGFIGSNLLETLLKLNQRVVGLDNLSTGYQHNLAEVQKVLSAERWVNFNFIQGDIRNIDDCRQAMKWNDLSKKSPLPYQNIPHSVDYVLHQAALGSVPRSIADPITTNQTNIDGFLNMLVAARDANISRFVYAASSSTYGDHPDLPKVEDKTGKPLSPYAITKLVNELYADVFAKNYCFKAIGLRYFNVFGRRQDPNGAYAAVIPKWIAAMIENESVYINGDGKTSRDFCHVDNVVQANFLAATVNDENANNQVYNVALGNQTSLNQLFEYIRQKLEVNNIKYIQPPIYKDFRSGDVRHSLASIKKANQLLGYSPSHDIHRGLTESMGWYVERLRQ